VITFNPKATKISDKTFTEHDFFFISRFFNAEALRRVSLIKNELFHRSPKIKDDYLQVSRLDFLVGWVRILR
jgi:hypothetical protein